MNAWAPNIPAPIFLTGSCTLSATLDMPDHSGGTTLSLFLSFVGSLPSLEFATFD